MKKIAVLCCAMFTAISAFAYYGDYGYSGLNSKLSEFADYVQIATIAYIFLSVIILILWCRLSYDVAKIRQHLNTPPNAPTLTYLIAIGEKEQAQKAALKMLVDQLYPIYSDPYNYSKADAMNKAIQARLPKIQKLGLSLPDYVSTGEKFIDYINDLTDGKVPYKDAPSSYRSN